MATSKSKYSKWFKDNVPDELMDSTLFKFEVNIGKGNKVEVNIASDLDIDYHDIQNQLAEVPSQFAYWSSIYSELKMQVNKIERQIKIKRGQLVDRTIKEATEAQVRLTDKQVQNIIESDDDLNKLESALIVMNKHVGKLYYMIEALRMKSDSIRSLAGFARQEMQHST